MKNKLIVFFILSLILFSFAFKQDRKILAKKSHAKEIVLSRETMSLEDRYPNKFVNDVFKENILLTLFYMRNQKINKAGIDWRHVKKPFSYRMVLKPDQTFAFHSDILPKYNGKVDRTTNAHFDYEEGFKSDGYLTGDGVCHLASLIYWVTKSAGLSSYAPVRHSFAVIPDIPAKYGVSIYDNSNKSYGNEMQNLYITNNLKRNVGFVFDYDGKNLKVSVVRL